jgi:DNA-directed RNA polymerase alpha subunit
MFKTDIKQMMIKPQTTDFFITCKESRIENNTSFYGCFYLGPFDESLSQTLANDLRRSLLSELTGFAITSIEIEGVLHKFSHVPGMKETVLDLICNLQAIVLKKQQMSESYSYQLPTMFNFSSDAAQTSFYPRYESKHLGAFKITKKFKNTYSGFLNVSGPRVITAKDLKLPAGLQCVDPNQYIATLTEDGVLNMKFQINQGKNFIKQKPYNLDVNVLKKRNILLQNFKKIQSEKNLFFSRTVPRGTKGSFYNREALSTQKNKEALLKTNPIPLDAVFMPVTKINCIVEENHIYSDFFTDKTPDQDLNNAYLQNNNEYNFQTMGLKSLKDFNSLTVNLPLRPSGSKSGYTNTKNSEDVSQLIQTQPEFLNSVRFIPWQKNDFYFDTVNLLNLGDKKSSEKIKKSYNQYFKSKSRIKLFLACNKITTFSEFKKGHNSTNSNVSFLQTPVFFDSSGASSLGLQDKTQTIPDVWLGFKLLTSNNILDKPFINNLLTLNKKNDTLAQSLEFALGSLGNTKNDKKHVLFTNKHNSSYVTRGTKGPSSSFAVNTSSDSSVYGKNIFKLNSIDGIIQSSQKKQYQNLLKLKPLQKKTNLIVEIWTNGSLHPRQALEQSFSFLSDNFLKLQTTKQLGSSFKSEISYSTLKYTLFNNWTSSDSQLFSSSNFESNNASSFYTAAISKLNKVNKTSTIKGQTFKAVNNSKTNFKNKFLLAPIEILKIPNLILYTKLKKVGIFTIKDLVQYSKEDLLKILCSLNTYPEEIEGKQKSDQKSSDNPLGSSEYFLLKSLFLIEKNLSYLGLILKPF